MFIATRDKVTGVGGGGGDACQLRALLALCLLALKISSSLVDILFLFWYAVGFFCMERTARTGRRLSFFDGSKPVRRTHLRPAWWARCVTGRRGHWR
jgi:hypothetical protein